MGAFFGEIWAFIPEFGEQEGRTREDGFNARCSPHASNSVIPYEGWMGDSGSNANGTVSSN